MSRTIFVRANTGLTIYAKPSPVVVSPWADDAVELTEIDSSGQYSGVVTDAHQEVYEQAISGAFNPQVSDSAPFWYEPSQVDSESLTTIINLLGTSAASRSPFTPGDRIQAYKYDTVTYPFTVAVDYTVGFTAAVLVEQGTTKLGQFTGSIDDTTTITWEYSYNALSTEPNFLGKGDGSRIAECVYVLVITETATGNDVTKVRGKLPIYERSAIV